MAESYLPNIIGIIITLLFSAFFSGMEIAFVASNRMLVEMDKDKRGLSGRILRVFYQHPNNFVSTMLVGNNIVLVIYGIFFADLFDQTLFRGMDAAFTVPADTILSTIIVLFTGEFLPKTLFKKNANRLLSVFALPAYLCYILLWPISRLSTMLSRVILHVFGIKVQTENNDDGFSRVDLDYLVQTSIDNAPEGEKIEDEVKIFQNALDFADTKVRDCMVPRTEIRAVKDDCSHDELMTAFIESGKSKILVYHENIDHITGYIHSSEMFHAPKQWQDSIRTVPFVPETMSAGKLMQNFLQQKRALAVVVDEFGGTAGIISLEDIVEEIFGEIDDEHDSTNYIARQLPNGEYLLSARLEIDTINEKFGLDLPESEEYMTLGGLILHYYRSFPKLNEVVTVGRFEFRIVKNTMTKIELVKLKVVE